jgi:Ca2+-binding EF-hand superfamily protein
LEAFSAFDTDKDSWLSYRELQACIADLGLGLSADDIVELILQVCACNGEFCIDVLHLAVSLNV